MNCVAKIGDSLRKVKGWGEFHKAEEFRGVIEFGPETDSFTCTGTESAERSLLFYFLT